MSTVDDHTIFVRENVKRLRNAVDFKYSSTKWSEIAASYHYVHNLSWMGRPILQVPQDIYAIQELCWSVKPDLIIETGIAHGGSLILSASMLALLDYCDAIQNNSVLTPLKSKRRVIGIDIDIREHNKNSIINHPLSHMVDLIEGSSTDPNIITLVQSKAMGFKKVLVFLDSNHTHQHVLSELNGYAPMVSKESYCVVWDTGIEDFPEGFVKDRPWGKGNSPRSAVFNYLENLSDSSRDTFDQPMKFVIDKDMDSKLMITSASDGFLKRTI